MKRWLWGPALLSALVLATVLAVARPGGSGNQESLAHIITPTGTPGDALVHVEIDADTTNGSGPCNPVDATAEVGGMHKVAVCLTSSSQSPAAFNIELLYDDTLDSCPDLTPGGTALDDNPDANAGATFWTTPNLGTNWDCGNGDMNPPVCDKDSGTGPGHGQAYMSCYTTAAPTLPVGAGVSAPLAVVTFNTTAAGVDNLAFGVVALYDYESTNILRCPPRPGMAECFGATVNVQYWTPTPTLTPTPTATPMPQLALDVVQDAGSTWCNPVNSTADVAVGSPHQAAICYLPSAAGDVASSDFDIEVTWDGSLNTCTNGDQTGKGLDANPDFISTVGTGWDCASGGDLPPWCTDSPDGPRPGHALISCSTETDPGTLSGVWPIAVINWTATAEGSDTLAFGTAALYDFPGNNLIRCPGMNCLGATVQKIFCSGDTDCDGVPDASDQCPNTPSNSAVDANGCSQTQVDQDSDGVCDPGRSSPRWCTGSDNCPSVYNPDQKNSDGGRRLNGPRILGDWASNPATDKLGDACDPDDDNDALPDSQEFDDQCPYRLVADSDGDRFLDGYEVANGYDPCDPVSKPTWVGGSDSDGDGLLYESERGGYNTCAFTGDTTPGWAACLVPQDSDEDGCADAVEVLDLNGDRFADSGDRGLINKRVAGIIPSDPVSDNVFDLNKDGFIDSGDQGLMNRNTCMRRPNQLGCPMCPPE